MPIGTEAQRDGEWGGHDERDESAAAQQDKADRGETEVLPQSGGTCSKRQSNATEVA